MRRKRGGRKRGRKEGREGGREEDAPVLKNIDSKPFPPHPHRLPSA
jgi:hypothetical protein